MIHRGQRDAAVGILVNPASGRDIRRLVAHASVFPTAEKANMVERLLSSLAAVGVARVFMIRDLGGIASRVRQAIATQAALSRPPWPDVTFLDMPVEDGPVDSLRAVARMVEEGVGAIIVLGGDGTNRLVASVCGKTPVLPLSTGTNNVFPVMREATIAGLAAGLVATGQVEAADAVLPNKLLEVEVNGAETDVALIDLCVSTELWIAARSLWKPENFTELYVTFAEADAIGLSAIAGLLRPVPRHADHGLRLVLGPPSECRTVVHAPIAPGLIAPIGVEEVEVFRPNEPRALRTAEGVIALDGEKEIEFRENDRVTVRLLDRGPLTIDIDRVMARAAEKGLLTRSGGREAAIK